MGNDVGSMMQMAKAKNDLSNGVNELLGTGDEKEQQKKAEGAANKKESQQREKDRIREYEQKKKDREARKKAIADQWAANKK